MNTLTWLIYLASLSGSLQALAVFSLVVAVIATGILTVCVFVLNYQASGASRYDNPELAMKISPLVKRAMKIGWSVVFIAALTATALPSKDTVYLMAASEAGEMVITNPNTQELFQDLTTLLKKKVKEQLTSSP